MGSEMCIRDRDTKCCGTVGHSFKRDASLLSRFVGQWDTVLKGRVNLLTDQQKRTVSVVGLWDTL